MTENKDLNEIVYGTITVTCPECGDQWKRPNQQSADNFEEKGVCGHCVYINCGADDDGNPDTFLDKLAEGIDGVSIESTDLEPLWMDIPF